MPHDVFISYSGANKAIADAACAAIEGRRVRCFIAPRDIVVGEEYPERISRAIEQCRVFVLIFSNAADQSKHVRHEVAMAFDGEKVIVTFKTSDFHPAKLKYHLTGTHWLDAMSPPLEFHLKKLAENIEQILNSGATGKRPLDSVLDKDPKPPEPDKRVLDPFPKTEKPAGAPPMAKFAVAGAAIAICGIAIGLMMRGPHDPASDAAGKRVSAQATATPSNTIMPTPWPKLSTNPIFKLGSGLALAPLTTPIGFLIPTATPTPTSGPPYRLSPLSPLATPYPFLFPTPAATPPGGGIRGIGAVLTQVNAASAAADANFATGKKYRDGAGVPKDEAEAARWFRKAADGGNVEAMYQLGWDYWNGLGLIQDRAAAVDWYRKGAVGGNDRAMVGLGYAYHEGLGIARDYPQAVFWYRKASDAGNYDGMVNLGNAYANGHGVPFDYAESVRWYRKAADGGNARGQTRLGYAYYQGEGVAQDYAEAARLYRLAATGGDADGMTSLGSLLENGRGVTKDLAEAARWYQKAADAGNAIGMYYLGDMFENGKGMAKDLDQAVDWYRKAAGLGNNDARNALTRLGK